MKAPRWIMEMSDDLLLHSYWETAPPAVVSLKTRVLARVRAFQDSPPWQTWSEVDWLYALTFVSIGVGILAEAARVYKLMRNDANPS